MREGPRPSVPFKSINIHLPDTQYWRPSLLQVLCLTDKRILKVFSEGNSKTTILQKSESENSWVGKIEFSTVPGRKGKEEGMERDKRAF